MDWLICFLGREVSIELIQNEISIERLIKELDRLFDVRFADKMKNDFQLIKHLLGSKNSSEVIAKKLSMLSNLIKFLLELFKSSSFQRILFTI